MVKRRRSSRVDMSFATVTRDRPLATMTAAVRPPTQPPITTVRSTRPITRLLAAFARSVAIMRPTLAGVRYFRAVNR